MSSALQTLNENNKVSEWAARITECRNSGLSVREWCSSHHICTQTYYRWQKRLKQAKPVLDAMFAWANSRTAAPKSALGKAFHYLKEQWPYLTNYLKDGRLEISNNRAERSIKPFVIDRKNFLFANTPKGATGSAIMFSLIQTAIENHLDPYRYLTWRKRQT